ncbi:MAG TPA: hypothetical protein VJT81_11745 [Burkholderiales bacterium]|nr:hypothetical protein [Burkholderiales bacterium]
MNRLLSALAAGMLALAIDGFAVVQDEPEMTPRDVQQDTVPDTKAQPVQPGDLSAREREYFAAVKKCEVLNGREKTNCIETTKKQFGQM